MSLLKKIGEKSAKVAVIGLGYVGLPLAVTAAQREFLVIGFDIDPAKVDKIQVGESYITGVSQKLLAKLVSERRLEATHEFARLAECSIIIICVPTPLNSKREPDLSYIQQTTEVIAETIKPDSLVVLESTTYPGTTKEILAPILSSSGLELDKDIFLAFSPEREDPGNTSFSTSTIPKIVAGAGIKSGNLVEAFYSQIIDTVVRVPTTETAEAVKITENVFRAVNIALVNELKLVFDAIGIDVWEVIDAAATKPFGFMPFYPGPGLGGHCIPIDPFYLTSKAREHEVTTRFIELAGEINTRMPYHVIARLREAIDRDSGRGLNGSEILLVGVAYKKNVSDMRESPAMKLMQLLDEAGARISYIDPHVPEIPPMREYRQFSSRKATDPKNLNRQNYAAIVIATDHDAIDYSQLIGLGCLIADTRNAIASRGLDMTRVVKV